MGRVKIEIVRIEDKKRRKVTCCKMTYGLKKKAHELSVLCDSDIEVVFFEKSGFVCKLFGKQDRIEKLTACHAVPAGISIKLQRSPRRKFNDLERRDHQRLKATAVGDADKRLENPYAPANLEEGPNVDRIDMYEGPNDDRINLDEMPNVGRITPDDDHNLDMTVLGSEEVLHDLDTAFATSIHFA